MHKAAPGRYVNHTNDWRKTGKLGDRDDRDPFTIYLYTVLNSDLLKNIKSSGAV